MADAVMDSILAVIPPEAKRALAARLGESTESVERGLAAACAAILDGLARKVGDGGFAGQLRDCAAEQRAEGNLGAMVSAELTGATADLVSRFLLLVFGSQQTQAASALAQQHALRAASAMALLRTAVPLVLVFLGRARGPGNDLPVATTGGVTRGVRPAAMHGDARARRARETEGAVPPRWLVPSAIAGALLLAWVTLRVFTAPRDTTAVATVTLEATNAGATAGNRPSEAAMSAWTALGEMMQVELPDGIVLTVPALGVEARLVAFLANDSAPTRDSRWFDFDRLLFDTGKATLQGASREQLSNIAAILRAFPQVSIRIGGYTDNSGDPAANLHLSDERANSVMDELVKLGIDPARMSARGYGQKYPLVDNSSEEGRQRNRRISLRVAGTQTAV